jgi:lysophospholipase L1-like esterase
MLVILGDSVTWGQGLCPAHKLDHLVPQLLAATHPGLTVHSHAHSGAVIGASVPPGHPDPSREVPVGDPTILAQAAAIAGDTSHVSAVLLNGGINDVDIRVIVNPFTSTGRLSQLIEQHCRVDMLTLLSRVCASAPDPTIPILVLGYYPILSSDSSRPEFPRLLEAYGLTGRAHFAELSGEAAYERWRGSVGNCLAFWHESNASLARAVHEFNSRCSRERAHFIKLPFTERNAVFASEPFLWGLDVHLQPEDEVAQERRDACSVARSVLAGGTIAMFTCERASVGHPNVRGAEVIAETVAAALRTLDKNQEP